MKDLLATDTQSLLMQSFNVTLVSPQSIDAISQFLDEKGLRSEVSSFFNPARLARLLITCTQRVADELAKHPDVKGIASPEQLRPVPLQPKL